MTYKRMTALFLSLAFGAFAFGASITPAAAGTPSGLAATNMTGTPVWVTLYHGNSNLQAKMSKEAFPFFYFTKSGDSQSEYRLLMEVTAPNGHFYNPAIWFQYQGSSAETLMFYICADKSGAYYWSRKKDCTK